MGFRRFANRVDAGRAVAEQVLELGLRQPVVIGLPRGGVVVAAEVAARLHAPLDAIAVRKVGVPGNEELGLGAISEEGVVVLNESIVRHLGLSDEVVDRLVFRESNELANRVRTLRGVLPQIPLAGREVVIVDDGVATGIDARAACRVARRRGAARVILAVPVAPADWQTRLGDEADEYIAVHEAEDLMAVGAFYDDFSAVGDAAWLACLAGANA